MNVEFWQSSCTGIVQCADFMPVDWTAFGVGVAVGVLVWHGCVAVVAGVLALRAK